MGRNLFTLGYRQRIGNNFNVDSLEDLWIPKEGATQPILTTSNIRHFTVAQLKDTYGMWKEALIRDFFLEEAVMTILNIPTSLNMGEDEVIWNYDPKG